MSIIYIEDYLYVMNAIKSIHPSAIFGIIEK